MHVDSCMRVRACTGIEGNFRSTCESVMRVLRGNRESVMAVLEAFVYDPLINWRLLKTTKATLHGETKNEGQEGDEKQGDAININLHMNMMAAGVDAAAAADPERGDAGNPSTVGGAAGVAGASSGACEWSCHCHIHTCVGLCR